LTSIASFAAVVCNEDGECWHSGVRHEYPAGAGVVIHEDDWTPGERFRFREHEGRGYGAAAIGSSGDSMPHQ
jgi:hypothetical protein